MNFKGVLACCVMAVVLPLAACSKKADPGTPILAGVQPALFWTTLASAQKLMPQPPVFVTVVSTGAVSSPWQAQDSQGHCYEQAEGETKMAQVSVCTGYQVIPSGEHIMFFKSMAGKIDPIGRDRMFNVYQMPKKDVFNLIVKGDSEYTVMPSGFTELFTRAEGSNDPWLASDAGKVYAKDAGKLKQVGLCQYRFVLLPNAAKKTLLLMSKGMGKNDKWLGIKDDQIYIEK